MIVTLHTSFADAALGEKVMGALLDHGVVKEDVCGFFPLDFQSKDYHEVAANVNHGLTTTTGADAAVGAVKGAGIGLGVGVIATLASLAIPGFGIVTGGGALVTALISAAATTAGGAVAGGVGGYLQDQGVDERVAVDVEAALRHGSAVVIVKCPSGTVGESEIHEILAKYGGLTFSRIGPSLILQG